MEEHNVTTKQKRNRVRNLMQKHGVRQGLATALSEYTEAFIDLDKRDMDRWLRELYDVFSSPFAAEQRRVKQMPTTFTGEDIIRARGMGVLLDFPNGRRSDG